MSRSLYEGTQLQSNMLGFSVNARSLYNSTLGLNIIATGDIDGDGLDDFVFANKNGKNELFLQQNGGTFSRIELTKDKESFAVALGDINGDGEMIVFSTCFNSLPRSL